MNIDRFKQQHVNIMQLVTELKGLVKAGVGENAGEICRHLIAMSSTIRLHLAAEDRMLYPTFQSDANGRLREIGKKFQDEMGSVAFVYLEFSRNWNTAEKIASYPNQFRSEANDVFKALHERVQREEAELYPLAEQL